MNYDQPEFQSKEVRLELEMASWIYQSHLWKRNTDTPVGIICEWCGVKLGGPTGITSKDQLCIENPKIKEMRKSWVKNTLKGMREAEKMIKESRMQDDEKVGLGSLNI